MAVQGMRFRDMAPQQKAHMAGGIGGGIDGATGQQCLDLRGGADAAALVGVIKRLDAIAVAGQQQSVAGVIPQGDGEHAAQPRQSLDPMAGIKLQHHLGVAVRAEHRPRQLQLMAQCLEIIDFTVEDDGQTAIGTGHGLSAGLGQIQNGQTTMGQPDPPRRRQPLSGAIGAACGHVVANALQFGGIDRLGIGVMGENGGKTAHGTGPLGDWLWRRDIPDFHPWRQPRRRGACPRSCNTWADLPPSGPILRMG